MCNVDLNPFTRSEILGERGFRIRKTWERGLEFRPKREARVDRATPRVWKRKWTDSANDCASRTRARLYPSRRPTDILGQLLPRLNYPTAYFPTLSMQIDGRTDCRKRLSKKGKDLSLPLRRIRSWISLGMLLRRSNLVVEKLKKRKREKKNSDTN